MNRILSRVLTLGLAVSAIGAALPACAKNDKSIFIQSVLSPPTNRANGQCTYTADSNAIGSFGGTLDIDGSSTYSAVMQVANQLIARADPLDPRAESNRIHLRGVVSRVTDANGNLINELTGNGTGFVDAASNNAPGLGLIAAPVIDQNTIDALKAQKPFAFDECRTVLTQLRVFGTTLGGEDIESGEFQFVVDVCRGRLIRYDTDPAVTPTPNCSKAEDFAAAATNAPCFLGQDESFSCHRCATGKGSDCDTQPP